MPRQPPAHNALLNGVLLHGRLEVIIERAEQLWEPDSRSARERIVRAIASGSTINPYVTMRLEQLPRYKRLLKTAAITANDAPVWNYTSSIDVASVASFVVIHVKTSSKDDQTGGLASPRKSLGFVRLRAQDVVLNVVDGWYALSGHQGLAGQGKAAGQTLPGQYAPPGAIAGAAGMDRKNRGRIKIKIQYWPLDAVLTAVSDRMPTVPGTYFRATDGCHVNFFQDAHCPKHSVIDIPGSSDEIYDPQLEEPEPAVAAATAISPDPLVVSIDEFTMDIPNSPVPPSRVEGDASHCVEAVGQGSAGLASCPDETRPHVNFLDNISRGGTKVTPRSENGVVAGDRDGDASFGDFGTASGGCLSVDDIPLKSPFPRATNYFEEIYRAIFHARKLVYITGWSVDTTMRLLREAPSRPIAPLAPGTAGSVTVGSVTSGLKFPEDDALLKRYSAGQIQQMQATRLAEMAAAADLASDPIAAAGFLPLGELLKRKADAGVRVLLLVWDEVFSTNRPLLKWMSLMDTKDEVTREFFKKTRVKAAVVPRIGRAGRKAAILTSPIVPCMFTFHEKLVITDVALKAGHHLSREEEIIRSSSSEPVVGDEPAAPVPESLRHVFRTRFPNLPNLPARPHLPNLDNLPHMPNLDKLRELPGNLPGIRSHSIDPGNASSPAPDSGAPYRKRRGSKGAGYPATTASSASSSYASQDGGVAVVGESSSRLASVERTSVCVDGARRPPTMPSKLRVLLPSRKAPASLATEYSADVSERRSPVQPSSARSPSQEMSISSGSEKRDVPLLPANELDDSGSLMDQNSQSLFFGEIGSPRKSPGDASSGRSGRISTLSPRLQTARQHIASHQLTIPNLHNLPTPRAQPTPASVTGQRRQLTAFIGGLDMTYGRFDTPDHSLFRSLQSTHRDDFHNACFDVGAPVGPREPWHDVATNVTGPVVRDFVASFEERWRRQGRGISHLVDVANDKEIHDGPFAHDGEQWSVQVFRSIDERSAVFRRGEERLLETKKGRQVDRSIHHAYVHYTRTAKRFIYIEQQYFIGSSNQWLSYNHGDATNLVPYEIALRIAASIRAGHPLRVYVVIPMWPEGFAADATIQKILFFQFKTVEMMYSMVADAILERKLEDAHPTDYLNFFCLGNREVQGESTPDSGAETNPQPNGPTALESKSSPQVNLIPTSSPYPSVMAPPLGLATHSSPQPPSTRGSPSGSDSNMSRSVREPNNFSPGHVQRVESRMDRFAGSRWLWGRGPSRNRPPKSGSSSGLFSRGVMRMGKGVTGRVPPSAAGRSSPSSSVTSHVLLSGSADGSSSSSDHAMAALGLADGVKNDVGKMSSLGLLFPPNVDSATRTVRTDSVPRADSVSVSSVPGSHHKHAAASNSRLDLQRDGSGLSFMPSLSLSRSESKPRVRKPRRGDEDLLSKSRRHPIYQHAKLFIRDDEVAVCGSANLNERSMSGVRDTEMAIGTFQPRHTFAHSKAKLEAEAKANGKATEGECEDTSTLPLPDGEVSRFRKRLWAEHALGPSASRFPSDLEDPGSLKCVRAMREIGKQNWDAYAGDVVVEMQSHLILYPYEVSASGKVAGVERFFPDTKGPICGTPNDVIPNILTS